MVAVLVVVMLVAVYGRYLPNSQEGFMNMWSQLLCWQRGLRRTTSDTGGCTDGNAINVVVCRWWSSCSFSLVFEAVFGLPLPLSIHGAKWTNFVTLTIAWFYSCCWCQWDCF